MKNDLPMMILISSPRLRKGEAGDLEEMFDLGLERLHLRKPDHSAKEVSKILDKLPEKYIRSIVLHRLPELLKDYPLAGYHLSSSEKSFALKGSCSRSFHTLPKLEAEGQKLDYGFFGPVYNSISKDGYGPKVPVESLRNYFSSDQGFPVYALGGIRRNKVRLLLDLGFSGVALLGAVWGRKDPVDAFEGFSKVHKSILNEREDLPLNAPGHNEEKLPPSFDSLRK